MKRTVCLALLLTIVLMILLGASSCVDPNSGMVQDTEKAKEIANNLQLQQPTPTDITYSLERYNLIRRTYLVNGEREKAVALPCPIADPPLGYVVLISQGAVVGRFVVSGME